MGQFRTVLVVRAADGEEELRYAALEGTQVLAESRLKLVETHQRLACHCLHEVLVGIACRRFIDEVIVQHLRQQFVEEGGLEETALAHEDEDGLAYHGIRYPGHHHGYKPFLEEVSEVFLGMVGTIRIRNVNAVGKHLNVVSLPVPCRESCEIIEQRIVLLAEVAVDEGVEPG